MEDSDAIKALIKARLAELGLRHKTVSRDLGWGPTYLHDYLVNGSPKALSENRKIALAQKIKLHPRELGVSSITATGASSIGLPPGFMEDAVPYTAGPDMAPPPPHIVLWRMVSRALDQHPKGILPGKVLAMNINDTDPQKIETGKVVWVTLFDRHVGTKAYGSVFRQFIAPNKLVTNSSEMNEILSMTDTSSPYYPVIKGTLVYVIDRFAENGNREDHAPVG